jgi:molybdopterin-guanine dinucleotide biosynthesis protein A
MGRDKASLPFGGETLLGRALRNVGQVVPAERIVCVAAPGQSLPPLPTGAIITYDETPHAGPLAGLAAGLAKLQGTADAVYASGCDMPLLLPAFIERMFELLADQDAAAPHDGERWHPLAAVYRTRVLPTAATILAAGERSLTALLDACRTRRVALRELQDIDPELASLMTCNTPADYQSALKNFGRQARG